MPVDVCPSHGGRRWHVFPRLTPVARFHSPYSRVYTYFPRQAQVRVREVFLRALWQGRILVAPGASGTFFVLRNDVITRDVFDQENNWAARHRPFLSRNLQNKFLSKREPAYIASIFSILYFNCLFLRVEAFLHGLHDWMSYVCAIVHFEVTFSLALK